MARPATCFYSTLARANLKNSPDAVPSTLVGLSIAIGNTHTDAEGGKRQGPCIFVFEEAILSSPACHDMT